ncbi:unnamed protein product [Effrenium voratum]|nr:unnamed protein product [Effrenium voratum]
MARLAGALLVLALPLAFLQPITRGPDGRGLIARRALPGRAKLPIFGDTLELLKPENMAQYQLDRRERWGGFWKTSVLFKRAVVVVGAKQMAEAMKQEARPGTMEAFFPPHHQRLFGVNSILMVSGASHLRLRNLIQKALTPKAIQRYQEYMDTSIDEFVKGCKQSEGHFPMVRQLQEAMVRIVVSALFGQNADEEEVDQLILNLRAWAKGLLSAPLTFVPWSAASRALRARKRVEDTLRNWISRSKEDGTLLSQLLYAKDEDGSTLSMEEVIDNVFTLAFAGTDTTASSLSSAFLRLSRDVALQAELRAAVAEGDPGDSLGAFLGEVLKDNPPAPFAMRLVKEPVSFSGGEVPSGWLVVYGFAGRCAEAKDSQDSQELSSNPAFGGGPRLCPGRFLATEAAKRLMQAVLGPEGFTWQLKEGQDLRQRYIPGFFPADGLLMKVQ